MEDKNERSYAKESTKTTPSGIRFDKEQLEFIQKKEVKLTTKQKVVDFLLNKFWWEHKVAIPSHKGLPPIENKPTDFVADFKSESLQPPIPVPKISTEQQYMIELKGATMIYQVESITKAAKADPLLTLHAKIRIENYGKDVSKEMFND